MLCTPFCLTSFVCFRVIVGGRALVSSFLKSARASAGFFVVISGPIFSGRSGNEMNTTKSPLPSALRKISCSMLKQPLANKQTPRSIVKPAKCLSLIGSLVTYRTSVQLHRFRAAIIDAVEQKLERAVRLSSKSDFRPKHEELALPNPRFGNGNSVLKIFLAPRPSAAKRVVVVKPGHRPDAFHRSFRPQSEHRAVVKKDIQLFVHSIGEWIAVVDSHLHDRTGNVVFLTLKDSFRSVLRPFDERVRDR